MTITSYEQLSSLGKIVYSCYLRGTISDAQLDIYVSKGRLSQEEVDYMRLIKNGNV